MASKIKKLIQASELFHLHPYNVESYKAMMASLSCEAERHHVAKTHNYYMLWRDAGYPNFELAADFTAAMLLTDPTTVGLQALKFPFPALHVNFPTGFFDDYVMADLQIAPMEHMGYVENLLWLRLGRYDDSAIILHMPISELQQLGHRAFDKDLRSEFKKEARAALLILNTMAFLAAQPESMERVRRGGGRRYKETNDAKPEASTYLIGRTIKIAPALFSAARRGEHEVAFRVQNRFVVRGHFRNQPCGKDRQERKQIWVAPHWKGPEEGARIIHTYKIQGVDL